jgi:hypothetical protein
VDCGIVILSEEGIRAANLKHAYVSNSRFRERQSIHVTDRVTAREAMATPADRELGMEIKAQPELIEKLKKQVAEMPKPSPVEEESITVRPSFHCSETRNQAHDLRRVGF